MKTNEADAVRVKLEGESDADWLSRMAVRDAAMRQAWSERWNVTTLDVQQ